MCTPLKKKMIAFSHAFCECLDGMIFNTTIKQHYPEKMECMDVTSDPFCDMLDDDMDLIREINKKLESVHVSFHVNIMTSNYIIKVQLRRDDRFNMLMKMCDIVGTKYFNNSWYKQSLSRCTGDETFIMMLKNEDEYIKVTSNDRVVCLETWNFR